MHEPLKGPSTPSSPRSPPESTKKYDHSRTKKPETERIRKLRERSSSPIGSPRNNDNNSSRRSRSIAVDKAIQDAKERVHNQRMNNDTLTSSTHTNGSTLSASAILDKRRPLHQDANGTIKRVSTVNENAISEILGITSGTSLQQTEPSSKNKDNKTRNGTRTRRTHNNQSRMSSSASPVGKRQTQKRRIPAPPSFAHQENDVMYSSDEEEEYNDKASSRPRKPRNSKAASGQTNVREIRNSTRRNGDINRQSKSLSPSRLSPEGGGKIRQTRKNRVESVSSLSGSDSETGRRSRLRRQQMREAKLNQSESTDIAIQPIQSSARTNLTSLQSSPKTPRPQSPYSSLRPSSKKSQQTSMAVDENTIPPPSPSFQSPSGLLTRGTVSPLSSPSHHNVPEDNISPLTAATKNLLDGPIRMPIPWANEADMGGAKKEPRKMLPPDDEDAEAEDGFIEEPSYEFGQPLEVDKKPIRPDRLGSIRSLNYKERHLRTSYPHELEMYKDRSHQNDPDYMPNQPTRRATAHRSSTGSFGLSSFNRSSGNSRGGRASMLENSFAHELDLYNAETNQDLTMTMSPSVDRIPLRPTRLASMQSLKLQQSLGDFSIGTFDTFNDGERQPPDGDNKEDKKEEKPIKEEAPPAESDDIESVNNGDVDEEEASIQSQSTPPPEEPEKDASSPLQVPHTVGGTAKKMTIFLSPLAKISLPNKRGSLRGPRTFGWKKDDHKSSWLPSLGGGGKTGKEDKLSSELDGSKRSTRSARTSKRLGRMEEEATEGEQQSAGSLSSGIKQAFQNRRARSLSPHGVKAASKKHAGRTKRKKQQTITESL